MSRILKRRETQIAIAEPLRKKLQIVILKIK